MSHDLPVLVIFFNRSDIFLQQLLSLKKVKPSFLYFAADGPRSFGKKDFEQLNKCKELISKIIDWSCSINFYYAENNFGCDVFVPMAISWFFSKVESGIILEDDCIISEDFYFFASDLLDKYKYDQRVMNISAPNFQLKKWGLADYYFSKYPSNWGWATWRRAWQKFEPRMMGLDKFLSRGGLFDLIELSSKEKRFWRKFFLGLKSGRYTFWDAKWVYSIWVSDGVSITPNLNLSSNIGYGASATHTTAKDDGHELAIAKLQLPIITLGDIRVEKEADLHLFKTRYKPKLKVQLRSYVSRLLKIKI